jgi:hypothetical protein
VQPSYHVTFSAGFLLAFALFSLLICFCAVFKRFAKKTKPEEDSLLVDSPAAPKQQQPSQGRPSWRKPELKIDR